MDYGFQSAFWEPPFELLLLVIKPDEVERKQEVMIHDFGAVDC